MIIIKIAVRSSGRPGIDLVDENFAEDTIGSASVRSRTFWRALEGESLGRISASAAKGRLQKKSFRQVS